MARLAGPCGARLGCRSAAVFASHTPVCLDIVRVFAKLGYGKGSRSFTAGTCKTHGDKGFDHLPPERCSYAGHSLTTLKRVASALDRCVEVRFVPAEATSEMAR
jgi:hypothetical protein